MEQSFPISADDAQLMAGQLQSPWRLPGRGPEVKRQPSSFRKVGCRSTTSHSIVSRAERLLALDEAFFFSTPTTRFLSCGESLWRHRVFPSLGCLGRFPDFDSDAAFASEICILTAIRTSCKEWDASAGSPKALTMFSRAFLGSACHADHFCPCQNVLDLPPLLFLDTVVQSLWLPVSSPLSLSLFSVTSQFSTLFISRVDACWKIRFENPPTRSTGCTHRLWWLTI